MPHRINIFDIKKLAEGLINNINKRISVWSKRWSIRMDRSFIAGLRHLISIETAKL